MLNIPNALTFLRALGVPLFLYLFLVAEQPVASFLVITVGGITDYLDGKIARQYFLTADALRAFIRDNNLKLTYEGCFNC